MADITSKEVQQRFIEAGWLHEDLRPHNGAVVDQYVSRYGDALAVYGNTDRVDYAGETKYFIEAASLLSPPTSSSVEMVPVAHVYDQVRTVLNHSVDEGLITRDSAERIYLRITALLKSAEPASLTYAELTSFMHHDTVSITIPRSVLPLLARDVEQETQRLQELSPLAHDMAFMAGTDEGDHPRRVAAWEALSTALKGQSAQIQLHSEEGTSSE